MVGPRQVLWVDFRCKDITIPKKMQTKRKKSASMIHLKCIFETNELVDRSFAFAPLLKLEGVKGQDLLPCHSQEVRRASHGNCTKFEKRGLIIL